MPYHAELTQAVHARGSLIAKHSDGNLWPILDDLIAAGFDGIHPIQPQSMDIGDVKRHCAGRACVLGNIDCMYLLPQGTTDEVEQAVRDTLRVAAPGGGYILSSSNSIHPDVKAENAIAMFRAARRFGAYPIDC
jgi:uroporphyrinogen decarboxylase